MPRTTPKQLDEEITTVGNFSHATKEIPENTQIYVQMTGQETMIALSLKSLNFNSFFKKQMSDDSYLVLQV